MMKIKIQKGITLIALVVTIIVLLILAGVTISLVLSQNGIFGKAQIAKEETRAGAVEEQASLWKLEVETDKYVESTTPVEMLDQILARLEKENLLTSNEVETIKKADNTNNEITIGSKTISFKIDEGNQIIIVNGVPVPRGFYHVGGTKKEGFVISDNQVDKNKDVNGKLEGNQFVWIPVDNSSDEVFKTFKRAEGYSSGSLQTYVPDCGEADSTGVNAKVTENSEIQEEAKAMYASVKKNGGFYMARYEAGNEE